MHFTAVSWLILSLATIAAAQLPALEIVKKIAPTAENCADTTECRTAEQATPFIVKAMNDYEVRTTPELAAVISLMAYESKDFKSKRKIGNFPGQGTANMQSAANNLKYAQSLPGVKDQVANITTTDGLSDAELNSMLALVTPDEYNFGSGAWYLTTQCDPSVREALRANPDAGFQNYIVNCVRTQMNSLRLEYFARAKAAFGVN